MRVVHAIQKLRHERTDLNKHKAQKDPHLKLLCVCDSSISILTLTKDVHSLYKLATIFRNPCIPRLACSAGTVGHSLCRLALKTSSESGPL